MKSTGARTKPTRFRCLLKEQPESRSLVASHHFNEWGGPIMRTKIRFTDSVIRNTIIHDPLVQLSRYEALFHSWAVPRFRNIERVARRKLPLA